MADNFDNYSMKVQARVDMPSNKDIDAQIRKLEKSISKLKVSGQFDDTALKNLTNQLNSLKATVSTANFSPTALSELISQVEKALGNIQISAKVGQEVGSAITKGMQQNIDAGVVDSIRKISDSTTSTIVQNEKKKQDAYRATTETVMYHAGVVSKLNKAETNGRFYGSNRGTGYFGTGHYFVDSATKHELDNNSSYSKLPYTSIDISKYDNLFKANTDEIANRLHSFLENLTKFTQGSDTNSISELFAQFKKVFGDTVMDMQEFDAKLEQLKSFMQNSSMSDRSDSVSTQFMKSLGYGGVDTRGTRYADTRYGTVIYDLKEESVLQANITDELQKQGQMLEKINYEKGQVFDKTEDSRIQSIIDQQARQQSIMDEYNKSFDTTNLNKANSELTQAQNRLSEIDSIIADCQYSIDNAEQEAQKFAKTMKSMGLSMTDEEIKEQAQNSSESYKERIEELSKERAELQAKIPVLEEVYDKESQLSNEALSKAREIVEQRELEAKKASETATTVIQNEEKKQQAIQETIASEKTLNEESVNKDKLAEKANKIQLSTDLTKLETDYKKFGVVSQEVENDIKEAKKAYDSFVNAKGTDRLEAEMNSYTSALAKAKSSWKELSATQVSLSQRTSQMTSMQEWMRKNGAATKLCGDRVKELIAECQTCNKVRFDQIKNEFKQIQVEAGKAGKLGSGFLEGLVAQGKKFVQWIGVTGTVMRGIQIGKDMIQDVKDLDDSLLELSKVSDLSASGLEKVTSQAYELGEKVARTGREVIDATTEFKRAGFDMQQSMDMAESAMVMTNVAENITDTADAAGTLISVLKGFNMDASETMTIVDKINQVSNTSPIGFDNIAEGLERTAGTMAQSGNTIDQTIGLITAGYAQLRNVEKVSTGLVTLSARLRGVGEDGEVIDGLSAKLQEDFGKIGVAIENADGSLRSIYEIAQDYSKVLPTLSDKQKQYYAELAAGKRQVTVWNAITQQFQDAEYAVNQSINSQNSALDENQKKLDSIGGHVKSFESAMEHLSSTVVESDLIKFFVDLGTTGVKAIDGLVNALSPLGTAALIGGGILGGKNLGKVYKCTFSNCFEYALYA